MPRPVCVSIGLPVFNAERYIASALEATLGQTFCDFELIVSDNASTDSTYEICEEFARADARIRLLRQQQNLGVNINHNRVFRESRGQFFRWASADDIPSPTLVEHAVQTLRSDPELVAYVPDTVNIDADGRSLRHLPRSLNLRSESAVERVEAVLQRNYQMVFDQGLMRRSILMSTSRKWTYFGWDFILLFELALRGKLANIEGPILQRRLHDASTARATKKVAEVREWVDPGYGARIMLPHWRWTWERVLATTRAPISVRERGTLLRLVLRHARRTRRALWKDLVMSSKLLLGKTDEYPF